MKHFLDRNLELAETNEDIKFLMTKIMPIAITIGLVLSFVWAFAQMS